MRLKLKSHRLQIHCHKPIRKKLQTSGVKIKLRTRRTFFDDIEHILSLLKKAKSYKSSPGTLTLKDSTNWELFESTKLAYYTLIESKSNKIQNITWNKNELLIQLKSHYFEGESFYVLFSTVGITYREKKR